MKPKIEYRIELGCQEPLVAEGKTLRKALEKILSDPEGFFKDKKAAGIFKCVICKAVSVGVIKPDGKIAKSNRKVELPIHDLVERKIFARDQLAVSFLMSEKGIRITRPTIATNGKSMSLFLSYECDLSKYTLYLNEVFDNVWDVAIEYAKKWSEES